MPRWPDGSLVDEDPHHAAARLDAETLGWRIWYGEQTGHFFAVRIGGNVLVEAAATGGLIEGINRYRTAERVQTPAVSPVPPEPRGQGAPARAGRRALRGSGKGSSRDG